MLAENIRNSSDDGNRNSDNDKSGGSGVGE